MLQDGRVMLIGGILRNGEPVATTEIFDPQGGSWSVAAAMPVALNGTAATVLTDGRVLVTGGEGPPPTRNSGGPPVNTAMIFDPATGIWTKTAPMFQARYGHATVLLADGRVMAIGGVGEVAETEIFDPRSGVWKRAAPLPVGRSNPIALSIQDGRVFVAGGYFSTPSPPPAAIFDTTNETWHNLGFPPAGSVIAAAFQTPAGRIVGFMRKYQPTPGGINDVGGAPAPPVDVYPYVLDVQRGSAKAGTAMPGGPSATPFSPDGNKSLLLQDGRLLTFQGTPARALLYDPARDAWSVAPTPPVIPFFSQGTLALLRDGRVLAFGGDYFDVFNPRGVVAGPSPASIGSPELSWLLTIITLTMILLVGIQHIWSRMPSLARHGRGEFRA